jgi:hypothetical protein
MSSPPILRPYGTYTICVLRIPGARVRARPPPRQYVCQYVYFGTHTDQRTRAPVALRIAGALTKCLTWAAIAGGLHLANQLPHYTCLQASLYLPVEPPHYRCLCVRGEYLALEFARGLHLANKVPQFLAERLLKCAAASVFVLWYY